MDKDVKTQKGKSMNNKVDKLVGEIREWVDNCIDEVRTRGGGLIKIYMVHIPEDMTISEKRNVADLICEFLPYNNINCTIQNMYSDAEYGQEIIVSIDYWFFSWE